MKSIRLTISHMIVLLLVSFPVLGDLAEDIHNDLKDDLYSFADLIPDFRPPAQQIRFAVADFHVDNEGNKSLGQAIAEILRFRIQFVPGVPLYMPAFKYTHVDAGLSGSSEGQALVGVQSFQHIQKSLGIDILLTGKISVTGKLIALDMGLVKASSGEAISHKTWNASREAMATTIIEISKWVYDTLEVKITPAQLAHLNEQEGLADKAIEEYLNSFPKLTETSGNSGHKLSKTLLQKHPRFALFALYTLTSRVYAINLSTAYDNLTLYERLEREFPDNPGVALESYRAMEIDMLPKHKVSRRADKMKQLVVNNPGDPTIMLNYADLLIKNGNALDGIAILLEALNTWPDQYRLWWSLGWALNSHAWEVRGDKFWRDVPERKQQIYLSLSVLANKAIDRAISMNPRNGDLLNMKINSMGSLDGYSEELLKVFDQAVQVAPNAPKIYHSAMNFAQGKWGGTALARRHIITTADIHNPGASWVEAMKRVHAAELESFQDRLVANPGMKYFLELLDHPYSRWVLIAGGVLIFWGVYALGRKSAFDELEDDLEQENSENDNPVQRNN